jgi:hypothetical protein
MMLYRASGWSPFRRMRGIAPEAPNRHFLII